MVKKEDLIVSLTTWSKRIGNIPKVLDTIYAQTVLPGRIVLNLAYDEVIPKEVQLYIDAHHVEVFRTENTKVYKKFIPTLKRYKSACVVNIDDDLLYPQTMLEDFWNMHLLYPDNPICGNHFFCFGRMCHCGEASLTKYEFFGDYLDWIDSEVMRNCTSSDIVFTYFATKAGHPYVPSLEYYGTGYTEAYNPIEGWSEKTNTDRSIRESWVYLEQRFGPLPELFGTYIKDRRLADIIVKVSEGIVEKEKQIACYEAEKAVRATRRYRLGKFFLAPFSWIRKK